MPGRILLLIVVSLACASCSEPPRDIEIPFIVTWGGMAVDCADSEPALTDLRFYASEVQLVSADGEHRTLSELAFIDLENGSGACQNGTSELRASITGRVAAGDYQGLRFILGVPFELNHADPLQAEPPLDDPAMHWHWRSGYKFLRAGVRTADDSFWIHLGSAGCEGTVQNITGCRFPNRVAVDLVDFDPDNQAVMLDLEALFRGVDLADGERGDCSSGPPETSCIEPFRALGIEFATGKQFDRQQVFSAYP